jgi:hypothetical protein
VDGWRDALRARGLDQKRTLWEISVDRNRQDDLEKRDKKLRDFDARRVEEDRITGPILYTTIILCVISFALLVYLLLG